MPRKSVAETAVETTAVEESTAAVSEAVNMKKEETKKMEALKDTDEIVVEAQIPHVSYRDNHTHDYYEWEKAGDTHEMTFEVLKRMHREAPRYFREMALRPMDERVVEKFGLKNLYAQYDYLYDAKSYTRDNMTKICADIGKLTNGAKLKLCDKLKDMVREGDLRDIAVVRRLEKYFDIDLIMYFE